MTNYPPYTPANEVRLGLVLYGGVSLAVYINGVTREFFRATRGQGVYALIKGLTDSDIGVDIVSGASAGGINGIFLAYALCNEKDFAGFAELWRDLGDISKLMRAPDRNPDQCQSLLDSEGYYEPHLAKAFTTLNDIAESYEFKTAVPELDLFITGTNVYGEISTIFDDSGDPIDIKNNRSVFHLKHRVKRKEPFKASRDARPGEPDLAQQALARLARLTSAFPAAFTPVHVGKADPGLDSVDARLQLWGGLGGGEAYFIDGGVLDNKPFTSTLHEIFYRMADRKVERRLLYVEPAPERFAAEEKPAQPDFFQVIGDALVSLPGYQSIGADLQDLNQHNSAVQQYNEVRDSISGKRNLPPKTKPSRKARAVLKAAKTIKLRNRALEGVLNTGGQRGMLRDPHQREAASRLVKAVNDISAPPPPGLLRAFDVYARLRRLFYLTYLLRRHLGDKRLTKDVLKEGLKLRAAVNYLIGLLDIIRTAMEDLVDNADYRWNDDKVGLMDKNTPADRIRERIGARVGNACKQLLDWKILLPFLDCLERHALDPESKDCGGDPASQLNLKLREKMDELSKKLQIDDTPLNLETWHGMLDETDLLEGKILDRFQANFKYACDAYRNFDNLDAYLYPLDLVSGLVGQDQILLTRVSPLDAQLGFCARDYREKLAGAQFYNFGGFFKRSWRSNDLLWGRLDGLCQLVECVFTKERLANALDSENMRMWLTGTATGSSIATDHPCHPATLFQGAGTAGAELAKWIERLLAADPAHRDAVLGDFERFQNLLIEAAHWKILEQDIGSVAADAIREQLDWNQFRVPVDGSAPKSLPFDAKKWWFKPVSGDFDSMVATLGAQGSAEQAIKALLKVPPVDQPPAKTQLGKYFQADYQVGAERLDRDLPKDVLWQIYSTGALLARNCIVTALGPKAEKITKTPFYTVFLDAPLRLIHAGASWLRRSPAKRTWAEITLALISLVLLVIGIFWSGQIFQEWNLPLIAIFLLGPVAVLGGLAHFILKNRPTWKPWKQLLFTAASLAILVESVKWFTEVRDYTKQSGDADFLIGMPILVVVAFLCLAAQLRAMFRARAASRKEIEISLQGMSPESLLRLVREFLLCDPAGASKMDPAALILAHLKPWPFGRAHRVQVEAMIRRVDRDALPNTAADLVKYALVNYFRAEEVSEIAKGMGFDLNDPSKAKWSRIVFKKAKKAHRLGELESRMREMHSMVL